MKKLLPLLFLALVCSVSASAFTISCVAGTAGNNNESYDKLTDGNVTTKWCHGFSDPTFFVFKVSEPIHISGYTITTGGDSYSYTGRNPKTWELLASTDSIHWDTIHTVTNDTVMKNTNSTPYSYTLSQPTTGTYTYVKWVVHAHQGASSMQMSEFAISGEAAFSYTCVAGSMSSNNNESYDKLTDGDVTTKWCHSFYDPTFFVFRLSNYVSISGYTITTASDSENFPGRNPKTWELLASTDGIHWDTIHTVTNDTVMHDVNVTPYSYTLPAPTPRGYTYVKWVIHAHQAITNIMQMAEFAISGEVVDPCIIRGFPWNEGFEEMATGDRIESGLTCWDLLNSNDGQYPQAYVDNWSEYVHSGEHYLLLTSSANRYGYAILPEITASLDHMEMSFWYKNEERHAYYGTLSVGYLTDIADESTFVELQEMARIDSLTMAVVPLSDVPAGARLAFRHGGGLYNNHYLGIDDISIHREACPMPTHIHLVEELTTGTSATIAWDDMGAEQYQVVVKNGNETLVNTLVSDTSCVIEGLLPITDYTLNTTLKSICGDNDESNNTTVNLIIPGPCAIRTLSWEEGFENHTAGYYYNITEMPCWDMLNFNEGGYPYAYVIDDDFYTSYIHSGTQSLFMVSSASRKGYAILPEITADLSHAWMKFWYRNSSADSNNGILSVGYMTDATDSTSFVTMQAMNKIASFTEVVLSLARVPVGARLAFCYEGTVDGYYLGLDDIAIYNLTCPAPSNIHLVEDLTTGTSATIAWDDLEVEQYRVVVTNGADTLVNTLVSDTSCVVRGLQLGVINTLNASVKAVCNTADESLSTSVSLTVETPCDAITTLPWSDGFEEKPIGSTIEPNLFCWDLLHFNEYIMPYAYVSDKYVHTGELALCLVACKYRKAYAILPEITADLSRAEMSFWYRSLSPADDSGILSVGYMTDVADSTSYVNLQTVARIGTFTKAVVSLSSVPTDARVAFEYDGGLDGYYYLGIDDISIYEVEGTPTGVNEVQERLRAEKVIRDGRLIILLPDGSKYDATGRRL